MRSNLFAPTPPPPAQPANPNGVEPSAAAEHYVPEEAPAPEEVYHQGSGRAFLQWYREVLLEHGLRVTSEARQVFGPDMRLAAKVSGIHWLRGHDSHAAEATAGYVGDYLNDFARMMAKTNTVLDFTCFEMQDRTQAWWAFSRPQGLVADAGMAARDAGIEFAGENALHCWESESAIEQIETACEQATAQGVRMAGFTALRLEPYLVIPGSPQKAALARFVANMKNLPARRGSRSMMEKLSIAFDRAYYTYKAATC